MSEILNSLYEAFGDFDADDLMLHRTDPSVNQSALDYWRQINESRKAIGEESYDGLLAESLYAALAEADPNLKTDALLRVAATAIAFAVSVQQQTDAFKVEEPKPKAKGGK